MTGLSPIESKLLNALRNGPLTVDELRPLLRLAGFEIINMLPRLNAYVSVDNSRLTLTPAGAAQIALPSEDSPTKE
jgi:hypothetical protein